MKSRLIFLLSCLLLVAVVVASTARSRPSSQIKWQECLKQKPAWYGSTEALRIADNVLLFQRESGGWPKNIEMAAVLNESEKAALSDQKRADDSTIDNTATYTQMAYLAHVFNATRQDRFKDAFIKGLDYLLAAQYENGGWPQYYPRLRDYYRHITFNDDAMIGVMTLLRGISQRQPVYGFVDEERRARSDRAVKRGIECILKCQIRVNGRLTVWCAQHDEVTFEPAPARSYEKVSLSGFESAGIVRFLMGIDRPSPQVIDAIESAVAWLEQVKLSGIKLVRLVREPNSSTPRGFDLVVARDAKAEPLWARFYEIGTNRPIFCGRDGIIKYSLAEIEIERRTGYNWYVGTPAKLLTQDYPTWLKKQGPGKRS